MKKLYLLFFLLLFAVASQAQLLTENFSYTSGTALTANGWSAHSAGGTNAITVTASGLSYTGHPGSGIGNAVSMTTSGEDDNKAFTSTNSGSVYMSFLVNLSASQATGDYFIGLFQNGTTFPLRIYARTNGAGFSFGVGKSNGAAVYEATVRSFGTVYFIAANYIFNTGSATDDIVNLWVNPVLGAAEPAATLTTGAGTADGASVSAVYLRQGAAANAPTQVVDAIIAGTTWAQVTPASCAAPATQANNITFSAIATTSMTVSWTNGNGSKRVVIMNTSNSFTDPADGTDPSANTVYGGSGEQVVYNNTGTSVTVTGLNPSTTYWFRVYEYNCSGVNTKYNVTTATNNPNSQATISSCTTPTTQASNITFTGVAGTTMTANWTNGDGAKRVVIMNTANSFTDPSDGSDPTANTVYSGSGEQVVYNNSGTSVTVTGLTYGTTYWFRVYEYNCSGVNTKFLTSTATNNPNSQATPPIMTYTWQGGSSTWGTAANWTPARTTPDPSDILIFNDGTSETVTGVSSQTIGQLLISNNTTLTLQAGAGATLTIGGGTGTDFSIGAGSQLTLDGANAISVNVASGATGAVSGNMILSGGAHRLTAADASGVTFNTGSAFTAGTGFSGNPFGTTSLNSIVFGSGSSFIQQAGSNPFGAGQPSSVVVFQTGSLFKMQANATPSLSGRTYADMEIDFATALINGTGSAALNIDNLTVTQGSLSLGMTGAFNIKGNISVAAGATLNFAPATAGTLTLNGTSAQTISSSGTLTFGANQNVIADNANGITLNTSVVLGSAATLTLTNGKVILSSGGNLTVSSITGGNSSNYIVTIGGFLTINNVGASTVLFPVGPSTGLYHPATINNTGTPDNFSVQVVTAWPGCTVGGPGGYSVQAVWLINEATIGGSNCTLTLDYAGAVTGSLYDPSGGQIYHCAGFFTDYQNGTVSGTVATGSGFTSFSPFGVASPSGTVPVKFTNVKASQLGRNIRVEWTNQTESDVVRYAVERSANGISFSDITTQAALKNDGGRADYSYVDATPITGVNFYRIRSLEANGKFVYSSIVKVNTGAAAADMLVFPNPVTEKQLSLQLTGLAKGVYTLNVINTQGQQVYTRQISYQGGNSSEVILLPASLKTGVYTMQLVSGEIKMNKPFIIK